MFGSQRNATGCELIKSCMEWGTYELLGKIISFLSLSSHIRRVSPITCSFLANYWARFQMSWNWVGPTFSQFQAPLIWVWYSISSYIFPSYCIKCPSRSVLSCYCANTALFWTFRCETQVDKTQLLSNFILRKIAHSTIILKKYGIMDLQFLWAMYVTWLASDVEKILDA